MAERDDIFLTSLRRQIDRRCPIFFLGSGASLHDHPFYAPSTSHAHEALRLPTAGELARTLAEWSKMELDGAPPRLLEAASYCEIVMSRETLVDKLRNVFDREYGPGKIHRYLASLEDVKLIVTTNYDCFIERAFREAARQFHLVVNLVHGKHQDRPNFLFYPAGELDPAEIDLRRQQLSDDVPVIFKIHGTIGLPDERWRDAFVVSEDDYYEMAGREYDDKLVPLAIRPWIKRSWILFVGYGLGDIHIRKHFLQSRAAAQADSPPNVLVNRTVTRFQEMYWSSLGVKAVACDADSFVEQMSGR